MVTAWLGVISDPPSEGRPRKVRTRDSFKQMLQIGEGLQVEIQHSDRGTRWLVCKA